MGSKREKQRVWPTAGVLAISVLVHVTLLFLPLPGPRHETAGPEPSGLRVELVPRPSRALTPKEAPPPPQSPEPPASDPVDPDPSAPVETAPTEQASSYEPTSEPTSPSTTLAAPEPASKALRTQLLGAARELGRKSERPMADQGLNYRGVPELPSQPGWLHQYIGPVAASVDRWRSNDGSTSARIVTASGRVVCVRTRAPTTAEIFNPWMSSAVPMMSFCGRERPGGVDREDPWLRSPGGDSGAGEKER